MDQNNQFTGHLSVAKIIDLIASLIDKCAVENNVELCIFCYSVLLMLFIFFRKC